jgi:hypothetical protein
MINRFRGLPGAATIALVAVAGAVLTGCCLCAFVSSQTNKASPGAVTPAATQLRMQAISTDTPAAMPTQAKISTPTIAPSATVTRPSAPMSPTLVLPTKPPTIAATAAAKPTALPTRPAPTIAPVISGYVCPGVERCIKGNINDGKKLYHLPECPSYKSTKIDESKGERLFATAAEAEAAGWSKAQNCP